MKRTIEEWTINHKDYEFIVTLWIANNSDAKLTEFHLKLYVNGNLVDKEIHRFGFFEACYETFLFLFKQKKIMPLLSVKLDNEDLVEVYMHGFSSVSLSIRLNSQLVYTDGFFYSKFLDSRKKLES